MASKPIVWALNRLETMKFVSASFLRFILDPKWLQMAIKDAQAVHLHSGVR